MTLPATSQPPRLMDQVRQAARLKHFSPKTEKSYLYYIHEFILFHNKRHPLEIGVPEIRAYLAHLAIQICQLFLLVQKPMPFSPI
jgi:hypothetical protein